MIRTPRSSTRMMHISIDPAFQSFAEQAKLDINALTVSTTYTDSPTRMMYDAYCEQASLRKSLDVFFGQLDEKRGLLLERQQRLEEDAENTTPAAYEQLLLEIHEATEELNKLEASYRRIEKTFMHVQQHYLNSVTSLADQYHQFRAELKKAFIDGGMSKFDDKNINDTLAYLYRLMEREV